MGTTQKYQVCIASRECGLPENNRDYHLQTYESLVGPSPMRRHILSHLIAAILLITSASAQVLIDHNDTTVDITNAGADVHLLTIIADNHTDAVVLTPGEEMTVTYRRRIIVVEAETIHFRDIIDEPSDTNVTPQTKSIDLEPISYLSATQKSVVIGTIAAAIGLLVLTEAKTAIKRKSKSP